MTAHEHEIILALGVAKRAIKGRKGYRHTRHRPKHRLGNLFIGRASGGCWLRLWNEDHTDRLDRYSFVFGGMRVVVDQRTGMVDGLMTLKSISMKRGCLSDLVLASLI